MMDHNSRSNLSTILLEALKLYDAQGWFVLPTDPGAKKPYFGFTYKERYGDNLPSREDVTSWPYWKARGVRLGVRTGRVSGIIVVDVDSKVAHDYIKEKGHPVGPMVQSPREGGGLHLYLKYPGFYVKSTVALGGIEGLDIRGDYGIVVAPPSAEHVSGRAYEWIISPEEVEVPDAPPWLIELLKQQGEFKERLDVPKIMAGVEEGKRDTELNRLAGKFRQMNLPEDVAVPMIEMAAKNCSPPFNVAEARAKVKWAYTHYQAGEDPRFSVFSPIYTENGKSKNQGPLSLASLQKPGPRQWLVEGLIPMKYPTTLYGSGGVSKSFLALSLSTAVAAEEEQWLGFDIRSGPVLYLDFELEVEEQTRRAYEVAAGVGMEGPPEDLLYYSASGKRMVESFEVALKTCQEREVKLLVVDSTGLALEGDSESARDVIAFFREVVGSFVNIGVCVLLIDHQSKMQGSSDNYQKKTAFGSGYKEYLARSAIQVELMNRAEGEITIRFRQKKTNFGSLVDPFELRVYFREDKTEIERVDIDDGDLASEESLGAEERVIRSVKHLETATPYEVAELSGLAIATVRKHFSLLKKRAVLLETDEVRERAKVHTLAPSNSTFSVFSTIGAENQKTYNAHTGSGGSENPENTENADNDTFWIK
jgi:hypothetical protein